MIATAGTALRCVEARESLAAYSLGALEPEERRSLDEHLAGCPACRIELATFDRALGSVARMAPPAEPPAEVRSRLLANVARSEATPAAAHARVVVPWRSRAARIGLAAAAILLLAAVAAGAVLVDRARDERDDARAAERMLITYLTSGGRVAALSARPAGNYGTTVGRGSLLTAPGRPPLVLVEGCPPTTEDRIYRVWVERNDERTPVGELEVDADGRGWLELSTGEPLTSFETVGVTMVTDGTRREDVLVGPVPGGLLG